MLKTDAICSCRAPSRASGFLSIASPSWRTQPWRARSLLCYWAVRDLGLPQTDLARMLHLLPEGICLSVKRGEALTEELGCVLLEASAKLEN